VPVRSVLTGTMLSVVAVTAAFTFGANLLYLVNSPRLAIQFLQASRRTRLSTLYPLATCSARSRQARLGSRRLISSDCDGKSAARRDYIRRPYREHSNGHT
jgi:hypothetical protein